MLRRKAHRKKDCPPLRTAAPLREDDDPAEFLDAFDSHCFHHDPVYRRLLGEMLAELWEDEDECRGDDRPLRLN